ncbi:hypothetical protein F5890DRAFT_1548691 [Lentinula detonsa]|uniref:Uncharacterized protein n=1 Tax=Lentinula detonsa TaxID=2804962 RepID=A0AA38QAT7_9AGAR|nr:hypothetical protein F5890DRAFT_1548691 [Lentinula detonsa]
MSPSAMSFKSIQTDDLESRTLLDNDPTSSGNTSLELTGYGDISQSEINFVPTLPSEVVVKRPLSYRRNAKRPLPPTICRSIATKFKDDCENLSALLDNLRAERENRADSAGGLSQRCIDKSRAEQPKMAAGTARRIPAPLQINKEARRVLNNPSSSPVSPQRPFRGNAPLPRRSPLPRWDLLDPEVYLEGKQYKIRSSSSS